MDARGSHPQAKAGKNGNTARDRSRSSDSCSSGSDAGVPTTVAQMPQMASSIAQLAADFQEHISNLTVKIHQTNLPINIKHVLATEVQEIKAAFNTYEVRANQEVNHITAARDDLQRRLANTARLLQVASSERDQSRKECRALRGSIEDLREKAAQSAADLENANRRFEDNTQLLTQKLKIQDEQLAGKRALWLDSNPGSSARRSAMTALCDPFNSPSVSFGKGSATGNIGNFRSPGNMDSMASPSITSPYNSFQSRNMGTSPSVASPLNTSFNSRASWGVPPPRMNAAQEQRVPRRRHGLPTLKAQPEKVMAADFTPTYITEPGDTPVNPIYEAEAGVGALVLFNKEEYEDLAPEFREALSKLFNLVEGWVKLFANLPDNVRDQEIMRNCQQVWEYMMNCTYPGSQKDAHAHVLALISDLGCRYWFVMRMINHYIFNDMLSIKTWRGFTPDTDEEFDEVARKLAERGLPNEVRQKLVDQRANTVKTIVNHVNYMSWRSSQLHYHAKQLREILEPVLNTHCDRSEAGKALGVLVIRAWDHSAKMFGAPLTFQVYFPETNSKFSATSMFAKDQPHADQMQLQIRQTRLKLVITPVVTLRDDRGTTIKAKNLHLATVLTMR
ncbi:hypothetical protein EG329_003568 [Mollisiaceae sp. DMI_Dod_QoI]|nr:hypothetical protein EG329_003568 [Helotiales sp. DMI_Dod_QoI]